MGRPVWLQECLPCRSFLLLLLMLIRYPKQINTYGLRISFWGGNLFFVSMGEDSQSHPSVIDISIDIHIWHRQVNFAAACRSICQMVPTRSYQLVLWCKAQAEYCKGTTEALLRIWLSDKFGYDRRTSLIQIAGAAISRLPRRWCSSVAISVARWAGVMRCCSQTCKRYIYT